MQSDPSSPSERTVDGVLAEPSQDPAPQDPAVQNPAVQNPAVQDPAVQDPAVQAARDIADVPAAELITTAAVHLMSAAAVKCGLAEGPEARDHLDLAEARVLITALAGLVVTSAPDVGGRHATSLRDGLRSLQLAFREASPVPDAPGQGPGERLTGSVV